MVLDDDDEPPTRGLGTENDPFMFKEWTTGDVISNTDHGKLFEITDFEDDDFEDDLLDRRPAKSFFTKEASSPRQSAKRFAEDLQKLDDESEVDGSSDLEDESEFLPSRRRRSRVLSVSSTRSTSQSATSGLEVDEEEGDISKHSFGFQPDDVRSPTPTIRPDQESEFSSARYRGAFVPPLELPHKTWSEDEEHEDEQEDDDPIGCIESGRPSPFPHRRWMASPTPEENDEEEDELPSLSHSQETVDTEHLDSSRTSRDVTDPMQNGYDVGQVVQILHPGKSKAVRAQSLSDQGLEDGEDTFEETGALEIRLSLISRKRLFYTKYWQSLKPYLERRLRNYYSSLREDRDPEGCWLYSGLRLPSRPTTQNMGMHITFRHNWRSERLTPHVVVISMLLKGMLSKAHIEGIIEHGWHASHLCGNWTCLNERHVHPESGPVNANRNGCLPYKDKECFHIQACLKHLKLDARFLRPKPVAQEELPESVV